MKSTGIVRRIDDLGRIVIPKELRDNLDINYRDALEIYVDSENIILRKYAIRSCIFCQTKENTYELLGKYICKDCLERLDVFRNIKN